MEDVAPARVVKSVGNSPRHAQSLLSALGSHLSFLPLIFFFFLSLSLLFLSLNLRPSLAPAFGYGPHGCQVPVASPFRVELSHIS